MSPCQSSVAILKGQLVGTYSDRHQELGKDKQVKGKDALTRILFKTTRMLYFELISELID